MDNKRDRTPLLADPEAPVNYGTKSDDGGFKPIKDRAWSFQDARRVTATASKKCTSEEESPVRKSPTIAKNKTEKKGPEHYLYCVVYAIVNVIISAPGLYGYAAVIFNNPVFENHMNALSKLVIFSSLIHQLGFFLFSSLDFAIGTVQDAGLIFLSAMANTIANRMLEDGHTEKEIVSTTLVLLSLGTAALGLVLMIMGRFRLADAVSYLPMPVVGGYLAFIGYFCCQAGVALCISKPLMTLGDWIYVVEPRNFMLALPGLATGLVLTFTSRLATNPGALPILMVSIPALFYLLLYLTGTSLDDVREDGWVGPVAPAVPVGDLFTLVDFSLVRWDLVTEIITTWVGMVFVVSFASCLDVAAISIDMGEPLETNRELATVGMCNREYHNRRKKACPLQTSVVC
jgi:SulP family sulfate permease